MMRESFRSSDQPAEVSIHRNDVGILQERTYGVQAYAWAVILLDITAVVFELSVVHFSCIGQWPWRQRLHVEKRIWSSSLEHLHFDIERRHRSSLDIVSLSSTLSLEADIRDETYHSSSVL